MQRYFGVKKENDEIFLLDSDLRHIKTVMRMNDNDEIEVVIDSTLYICCLQNVKKNMRIKVKKIVKNEKNEAEIILIIPVLKEQKMDYILQKSTELGVSKIIPILTERTIIKLDEKACSKKLERWGKIVKEAAEQSKRLTVPKIEKITNLKNLKIEKGINLLCSTICKKSVKTSFQEKDLCDRISVVIGPEGGLSEKEEKYLNKLGFESISLGNRILRVETAPIVILSIINYINME